MAADLHIHVFAEGELTEENFRAFFSNTLGSRWFNPISCAEMDRVEHLRKSVGDTPSVWVGEVSWLKAALFEDDESYIPEGVGAVNEIIGEDLPVVDDELIEEIRAALCLSNGTARPDGVHGGVGYGVSEPGDVCAFLEQHKGERAFTISW